MVAQPKKETVKPKEVALSGPKDITAKPKEVMAKWTITFLTFLCFGVQLSVYLSVCLSVNFIFNLILIYFF